MKHATFKGKTARQSRTLSRQDASSGQNAISIAPPDYGIDFVDSQSTEAGPLQGKFETVQRKGPEVEEELIQEKFKSEPTDTVQAKSDVIPNKTGLPDNLKAGIENLSGLSMDDVKVHYNSSKPADINARAFTQGTDIHVASGQEKHLPHEGWHAVQQAQGRVQPTMQMRGNVKINDDAELEKEADVMGVKAATFSYTTQQETQGNKSQSLANEVSQKQSGGVSTLQFVDNRPEAVAQRKLQQIANNSPQAKPLITFQKMVNTSPQAKQTAQLQAVAKNPTIQREPLRETESGDQRLKTYEDIINFVKEDKAIGQPFYDYLIDPRALIENFIAYSNEYNKDEGAGRLLQDLEKFMEYQDDIQDEYSLDDLEQFELDYLEQRERNQKKPKKVKSKKNQKKKSKKSEQSKLLEEFSGMSGKESTTDLNPIESLQEGIFSNLYQGGKESDFRHLPSKPDLKKLSNAKDFLENTGDRNYKTQLESTRAAILDGNYLVRKMSKAESKSFRASGGSKEKIFPPGTEGMKAFRIDESYTFKDPERNDKEGDYEIIMIVRLSAKLKTYFINFLSANVRNPLGVQDKNLQFGFNPQFKFENGGVTILIPPSGWEQFWSFVNNDIFFRS